MQPYYLPFIGYFQLINKFIIYDDAQFEKARFLTSNKIKNLILFIKNRKKYQ
jgi:hypothetical protein